MKWFRYLIVAAGLLGMMESALLAAPIGIPGATIGANKSAVGPEVYFLFDRNMEGGGGLESTQAFAKGEVGLTDRIDLNVRLGFGDFRVNGRGPENFDTDTGPAYGLGLKATLAAIPDARLKVGAVLQSTRVRAEASGKRIGWNEDDAAIGVYLDGGVAAPRAGEAVLIPYGGIAWSGVDINGAAVENDTFGIFLGVAARIGANFRVGVELRVPEQTSLGIFANLKF